MASDYKESCNTVIFIPFLMLWAFPLYQNLQSHMYSTEELTIANARMHATDNRINTACQCTQPEGYTEDLQPANNSRGDVYWNTSLYAVFCQPCKAVSDFESTNNSVQQMQPIIQMLIGLCFALFLDELVMMIMRFFISLPFCQHDACSSKVFRTSCINNSCCKLLLRFFLFGICVQALLQEPCIIWSLPLGLPAPKPSRRKDKHLSNTTEISGPFFVKSNAPNETVRTHVTIGDGNCFWRALAYRFPCKWYTLKKRILRHAEFVNDVRTQEKDELRKLKKKNAWANSIAIRHATDYLQCNLAIWHKGGFAVFPCGRQNTPTIFLTLHSQHFEALPTKTGLKLLATCDPHCPIPVEALNYCEGPAYKEGNTKPQRTIKIERPKIYDNLTTCLQFPRDAIHPDNIGYGIHLDYRDCLPTPGSYTKASQGACNKQLRNGKATRRIWEPTRTSWPAWYLLVIFGLHCIGIQPRQHLQSSFHDIGQLNLSSYTLHMEAQCCNHMCTSELTIPAIGNSQPNNANSVSDLWCKNCIGAVDACRSTSTAQSCSQDDSATTQQLHLDAIKFMTPLLLGWDDHFRSSDVRNYTLWGGFCCSATSRDLAMVVSRAEVELEKRLRGLRSDLDTDDSITSEQERQQLNNRYQTVMRALLVKRIARSRSRTPIRRRTRRELNRLMRGSDSGLREAPPQAALEQHRRTGQRISRSMQPTEPVGPPPWCRQFYIETWGSSPQRPMTPSVFTNKAQAKIDVRLHDHNDPGRDPCLHKHVGLHCTTLLRVGRHIEIQKALACILRIANRVQSVHVSISCAQGRHRSVAFSECLRMVVEMQRNNCSVEVHHRAAKFNWWRLCQTESCQECNLHRSMTPEGQSFKNDLQQALSTCLTLDVAEHPYVQAQPAPAYTACMPASCCAIVRNPHANVVYNSSQDDNITSDQDALEHPVNSAALADARPTEKALLPSLTCSNKIPWTLPWNPLNKEMRSSPEATCHTHGKINGSKLFKLLSHVTLLGIFLEEFIHLDSVHHHRCEFNPLSNQVLSYQEQSGLCSPACQCNAFLINISSPNHFPYYLVGKEDELHFGHGTSVTACNSNPGNYDGINFIVFGGLPNNPYGVHLSGGCIGAAHTPEGDHCKSPGDGLPKPLFGFLGSFVCRILPSYSRFYNLGCDIESCNDANKADPMNGNRTRSAHWCHVETTCFRVEYGPQLCCMLSLICMCSKECIYNQHDNAATYHKNDCFPLAAVHQDLYHSIPCPWVQLEGGYVTGDNVQPLSPLCTYSHFQYLQACLSIMPASPAELLLERQMIRLRTDLQHGPVQGDAQLIADMERQYRDLEEDLETRRAARSRSREPIRRRSQYELNRLMRGQTAPKAATAKAAAAAPKAAGDRPVTPPKSPPPVRPKTPPKGPPSGPPLTVFSTPASSGPRPSAPLTPMQPSYPPPKVASGLQTMHKATAKAAGLPKPPSTPPPTAAKTAGVPKQPSTPPPTSTASSPTRSITAKLVVSKARPKARPSAKATAPAPTSAEVPSSSKAPAPPLQQANAPDIGPPPAAKKIYIDSYGLRPDNPMAPQQSHPDVQLDVYVDLRRLHNPQQNRSLRSHTGLHKDTILEIARHHEIPRVLALILQQCNAYDRIHVHIACTQGRHRSVGFSGILRQTLLSHMPQALVFVTHRAAQNNWGPLRGLARCSDCSIFRSLSPEGQALRNKVATAISSCFTLAVNSHPYVQLEPRYMPACPLCTSDLNCLCLTVQPAQDLQYNPPLSGGALERHHKRGTAPSYNAMPPCLVWYWVLLKAFTSPGSPRPHYTLPACKELMCQRQRLPAMQLVDPERKRWNLVMQSTALVTALKLLDLG